MTTLTIVSVTKDSPGAGQFTIVGTYADQSFTLPSQQVTVENTPTGNTNWSRAVKVTEEAITVMKYGSNSVAFDLVSFCASVPATFEPTLTWSPKITTQPVNDSAVQSSTSADFTVVVSSEIALTYAWKESADGTTYGSALTTTGIYNVSVAGTLTITPTDTSKDGYYYKCTITNSQGSITSDVVQLTVT